VIGGLEGENVSSGASVLVGVNVSSGASVLVGINVSSGASVLVGINVSSGASVLVGVGDVGAGLGADVEGGGLTGAVVVGDGVGSTGTSCSHPPTGDI